MPPVAARPLRRKALTHALLGLVGALALTACASSPAGPTAGTPASPDGTPATTEAPRSTGTRSPLVLIVMENHEASSIVGSSDAPYLNGTLIPGGRLFTSYTAVSHPSLPNYLAMTAGSTLGKKGTDSVTAGELSADNLFHQLTEAGIDWRAFQESMPTSCYRSYSAGSSPNQYVLKHNPAMTFSNIADGSACEQVVPLSQLEAGHLPPFSFITPDECNDMHSCPVRTGDEWLSRTVPPLLAAGATVVVTFDEGTSDTGGGGTVATVEAGPNIPPGTTDAGSFDHYSLLAAIEDRFGLPRLGQAQGATPLPL